MSAMDALERARRLRNEADEVLERARVLEILRRYGRVVPTGSYFLDVMAFPDIDLYVSGVPLEQLFAIGAQLAASPLVFQVVFEKTLEERLAGGLYLKPRIRYGDWGRPWKVDIWSFDDARIEGLMAPMRRFRELMTPQLREQIIRYKVSLLNAEGRTPMQSGWWIYKAFLEEGITDPEQVGRFLVDHGIQVETPPCGGSSSRPAAPTQPCPLA
jgi:hypothetical protein